ncbi:MAG TPA: outer membrane lipoprotein carrier protein LolA [Alphaproteobacteria bacterium]|nr:outer membrane lipoprotein carrier protein LolA [Alphaproteobacteria bacterium]
MAGSFPSAGPSPGRRRALALLAGAGAALLAGSGIARAALGPKDEAAVTRVQDYLNGIQTATARFEQIGPDGGLSRGRFYLKRPGRLRFEYEPPTPLLIVADGTWLIVYDKELKQVSRFPLFSTPLGVLVADRIDLGKGVKVTRVDRQAGILRLRVIDTDRPNEGWLGLAFSEPPLQLRQWHVKDAQGGLTNVALADLQTNVSVDPALFVFHETYSGQEQDHQGGR